MTGKFDSASDQRTQQNNNDTRNQYRVLSDLEKARMKEIKDSGADLIGQIRDMSSDPLVAEDQSLPERNLELARRAIEDGVMRAVRHLTS